MWTITASEARKRFAAVIGTAQMAEGGANIPWKQVKADLGWCGS